MKTSTIPQRSTSLASQALEASNRYWERHIRAEPWLLEAEPEESLSEEELQAELEREAAGWAAHDRFLEEFGHGCCLPSFFLDGEKKLQEENTMKSKYGSQMKEAGAEEPLGFSPQKIEELIRQPVIESRVWKSKDGEWVVHKTTITDIRPVRFYEKVLESEAKRAGFRPMPMGGGRDEDL